MSNQITYKHITLLCKFATDAHTIANAIYNLVRGVGHESITADNALHIMVEHEHLAQRLGDEILEFKRKLQEEGEK